MERKENSSGGQNIPEQARKVLPRLEQRGQVDLEKLQQKGFKVDVETSLIVKFAGLLSEESWLYHL